MKAVFVVLFAMAAATANAASGGPIQRIAWLQGCWELAAPGRTIEEQWMAPRGKSMFGVSRTVLAGSVAEYEFVAIRERGDRLAYEAHPSGQPSAVFLSGGVSDTAVVFEDPSHDFPQRIGYRRVAPDSVLAWIEGTRKGKERRIEFSYRRAACPGAVGVAGSGGAPGGEAARDSLSIRAVLADLDSAWAHGDADRWVAHDLPDAEFINIFGMLMPDRQATRARHDAIFKGVFKGSRYAGTLRRVQFLGSDAAIADVDVEVTGFSALPPGSRPTSPGVLRTRMRHILRRIDGRWWIAATQNTAVAPAP